MGEGGWSGGLSGGGCGGGYGAGEVDGCEGGSLMGEGDDGKCGTEGGDGKARGPQSAQSLPRGQTSYCEPNTTQKQHKRILHAIAAQHT